jgi:hypothetical protein
VSAKVISVPHLRVSLEGKIEGRGHAKRDALGWAIPVLWPVKLATLPARGPRPALKGETRITLRLLEDVEVPATIAGVSTTSSLTQNPRLAPSSRGIPFRKLFYEGSREHSAASPKPAPLQNSHEGWHPRPLRGSLRAAAYLVGSEEWYELSRAGLLARLRQAAMRDPGWGASCSHCRGWIWMRLYGLNRERGMEFAIRSRDSEP